MQTLLILESINLYVQMKSPKMARKCTALSLFSFFLSLFFIRGREKKEKREENLHLI